MNDATQSLRSFLSVIKVNVGEKAEDDYKSDDDDNLTLESNVSKIGTAIENMQSIVGDTKDETDELQQELKELREKWHESRGELLDLKEDYEVQGKRCDELEEILEELEHKNKTMQTMAESVDEEEGEQSKSDASQGDDEDETESNEMEQVARARVWLFGCCGGRSTRNRSFSETSLGRR